MSRLVRYRRRRRSQGRPRNKLFLATAVALTAAALAGLSLIGYIVGVAASAPSLDTLKPMDPGETSVVYASGGERLGFIQADQLRQPVSGRRLPRVLKEATVAIEDERFYAHRGIDYPGVVRAALKNLTSGKTIQGGSTITMQLVRNLYITKERTFQRKIREAKLAEELEDAHSKSWILDKYLNSVPYGTVGGQTAIGAQAAARIFFDKPVARLRLHEAALLAGLPQAPSVYNPFRAPDRALERRNEVLAKMAELRMVSRDTARRAMRRSLGVKPSDYYTARREQYFFDYVKDELIKEYGAERMRKGGLRIHTTIDLDLQKAARSAIKNVLNQPDDPASAVVTVHPRTGYIRAMASSADYSKSKFNLAAQGRRQPGSTFKIMALMAALRRGVDPRSTTYVSRRLKFQHSKYGEIDVQTYDHTYGGRMDLVRATTRSDNSVYMQLALDLGPDAVAETARDMGIRTKLDGYPSESLGGLRLGVSPLEMAVAYASIANGGWRVRPIAVTRVVFPDGEEDDLGKPRRKKVFKDGVTAVATDILERNMEAGTGTRAQIGCPAAGKTGTTDSYNDAWFVGYTPRLSTSVWVGYPNAQIEMRSVHGIPVAGGTFPADIWGRYMRVAKRSYCGDFPEPEEPVEFTPYFGQYARTGAPGGSYSYGTGTGSAPVTPSPPPSYTPPAGQPPASPPPSTPESPPTGDGGQGNGREYDPDLYESPPQGSPPTGGANPGGGNRGNGGAGPDE